MSANGSAVPSTGSEVTDKGKGKATQQPDIGMEEEDSEDEVESGAEEVSQNPFLRYT